MCAPDKEETAYEKAVREGKPTFKGFANEVPVAKQIEVLQRETGSSSSNINELRDLKNRGVGLPSLDPLATTSKPPPTTADATDLVLKGYARSNLLSTRLQGAGRKGSFLTGAMGDVTAPPTGPKSILGATQ